MIHEGRAHGALPFSFGSKNPNGSSPRESMSLRLRGGARGSRMRETGRRSRPRAQRNCSAGRAYPTRSSRAGKQGTVEHITFVWRLTPEKGDFNLFGACMKATNGLYHLCMQAQAGPASIARSNGQPEPRRVSHRFPLRIPVALDDLSGLTRNVSASGLYFETEGIFLISKTLDFDLLLPRPSGAVLRLRCQGEVVRVEPAEEYVGIAVRFTHRPFDDGVLAQASGTH